MTEGKRYVHFTRKVDRHCRVFHDVHGKKGPWPCRFRGEPVTKDQDQGGRSLLIHHIDGDHSNNAPQNLAAAHWDCHAIPPQSARRGVRRRRGWSTAKSSGMLPASRFGEPSRPPVDITGSGIAVNGGNAMDRARASRRLANQPWAGRRSLPRGRAAKAPRMSFVAKALACGATVLVVFAFASVPAAAGAETREYTISFSGHQSESYSAHYSCCAVERAGYVGCNYIQTGDATVDWLDEPRVTADVFPKSGHVEIGSERHIVGPRVKHQPGDSEISGRTRNSRGNTECSDAGKAGRYDCTAEAVVPKYAPKPPRRSRR